MKDTILIIANGEHLSKEKTIKIVSSSDIIIAADGGAQFCHDHSINPDHIIGDLDSITEEVKNSFRESSFIHRPDQNLTDLQKAMKFSLTVKPARIRIINALGLRTDHSVTNLMIFHSFKKPDILEIYDNYGRMKILLPGRHQLNFPKGQTISLFSLQPIGDLTLEGFFYPLTLQSFDHPFFGISNCTISEQVSISFSRGKLFLYELFNK
jgi:thiamine pyrophosphokinase